MSDYVPKLKNETNRSMFFDETMHYDPSRQSTNNSEFSFFKLDDKWNQPPSPILPSFDEQTTYKLSATDNLTGIRQVGVVNPSRPKQDGNEKNETLIEKSRSNILSIISLLNEHVISHPFIVIRRQAQVNNRSQTYHLTPFTVIPFMLRLQSKQGISTFFKGLPSVLINYILLIGSESFFYNILQFPIEHDFGSLTNLLSMRLLKHLALKSLSILVVTPFICSSSIEVVQSWIVGESPYPLEHLKEGLLRVIHFRKDRKLPYYRLIGPSTTYHLCYYVLYSLIRQVILKFYYNDDNNQHVKAIKVPTQVQLSDSQFFDEPYPQHLMIYESKAKKISDNTGINELKSSFYAHMLTDIIMYPFQNILYRLFLQGTRTLIDNVDGKTAVIPLITNYDSALDCYQSILQNEGTSGLFKGFGALILQYSFQASIIHLTNYCIDLLFNC